VASEVQQWREARAKWNAQFQIVQKVVDGSRRAVELNEPPWQAVKLTRAYKDAARKRLREAGVPDADDVPMPDYQRRPLSPLHHASVALAAASVALAQARTRAKCDSERAREFARAVRGFAAGLPVAVFDLAAAVADDADELEQVERERQEVEARALADRLDEIEGIIVDALARGPLTKGLMRKRWTYEPRENGSPEKPTPGKRSLKTLTDALTRLQERGIIEQDGKRRPWRLTKLGATLAEMRKPKA
jgi:hypothetical protein